MNILQDTVHDGAASHSDTGESNSASGDIHSFDTQIRRWNPPLQLDDIDNEYLAKKKVFELPPAQYMSVYLHIASLNCLTPLQGRHGEGIL